VLIVKKRKFLVFAHVPPPHHGQSVMVQILLEGLRADPRFDVHHLDARVSDDLEDIGSFRPQKFLRLFKCIAQAWWLRLRHGRMAFYYVPAPAKRSAIIRDWLVMAFCRPFFSELILHWHAYGLGEWATLAERPGGAKWPSQALRKCTVSLLGKADLSIAISEAGRRDAACLAPRKLEVVANGIDDPCPRCEQDVLPARRAKLEKRALLLSQNSAVRCEPLDYNFLFMAHCTKAKGLFDALGSLRLANKTLESEGFPLRIKLAVAGEFVDPQEKARFRELVAEKTLENLVDYIGFASGQAKIKLLRDSDCLLCPTHWDNFPTVILEAMAFGLPVIASDCGSLPDMFPANYPWIFPVQSVRSLHYKIIDYARRPPLPLLRAHYLKNYTSAAFINRISSVLLDERRS
jgi:glycosyltransferase involved in cell wall biosynthesis